VCGLEDLAREPDVVAADLTVTPGPVLDGWQVMVDTVTGRLTAFHDGTRVPSDPDPATSTVHLHLRHAYGGTADVGAGTYDRTEVHDDAITTDVYVRAIPEEFVAQHVAHLDSPPPGSSEPPGRTLPQVLDAVADEWAGTAAPGGSTPTTGSTTVVSVADSGSWSGDLSIDVPPATRLVLVAAGWSPRLLANGEVLPPVAGRYAATGLRPCVHGTITVTGGAGSSIHVDGLVLDGDLVVTAGDLASLTVSQSTVTGTVRVNGGAVNRNHDLQVRVLRSAVGGVTLAPTVPSLHIEDSVVSAEVGDRAVAANAVQAPGALLEAVGSTVRGGVQVRTLAATDSVLDGTVTAQHRQTGCCRYTYLGPGSRVPRRFRCVPPSDAVTAPAPVYVSDLRGSPSFLALAPSCPVEIREGGEDGSEMGVHSHLRRPGRVRAAERLLTGYVPVGLEIGMVRDG